MKFIATLALAAAVVVMAEDKVRESTQWTNSKCDADIISQSYLTGSIDISDPDKPELTEFTEETCKTGEFDCNEATGWEAKCVGSVGSGPSGYHKYESHVPTKVTTSGFECENKDGDVYNTAYYFNGCVNEAEEMVNANNFTYKSSTNDCSNDKTTFYADKDCSGDSDDIKADDAAKECSTKSCAGCFVATASFDSFHHESVASLRAVRDAHFNNYAVTRAAWSVYMTYGPAAAAAVAQSPVLKMATRALLTPVVEVAAMLA